MEQMTKQNDKQMTEQIIEQVLQLAHQAIEEKHGVNTEIINIGSLSPLADYFIITNANNTPQLDAIVQNIDDKLSQNGYQPKSIEGHHRGGWVLLDYGDIVIHVFDKDQRGFYNLERLWADGEKIAL